jgi:hypothetical protein
MPGLGPLEGAYGEGLKVPRRALGAAAFRLRFPQSLHAYGSRGHLLSGDRLNWNTQLGRREDPLRRPFCLRGISQSRHGDDRRIGEPENGVQICEGVLR